jgi:Tol biopolymer transport system component
LDRGTSSRLTFSGNNQFPVWSPDGTRVAYLVDQKIHVKAANGTGQDEVRETFSGARPTDWSRDGKFLFFETPGGSGKTLNDVWILPESGDKKPYTYVQTEYSEGFARLSPDGRWLAYRSNESKRNEIYVVSFPKPEGKWQISTNGGSIPVWSRDGHELFFVSADNKLMAVEIKPTGDKFQAGIPKPLFDVRLGPNNPSFDVSKDGRFLIPTALEQTSHPPITLQLNWGEVLQKK